MAMASMFNLPILVVLVYFQGTIASVLPKNHTMLPQVTQLAIEASNECKVGPINDDIIEILPDDSIITEYIKELFEKDYSEESEYDFACTIACTLHEMHVFNDDSDFVHEEALKLGDKIQGMEATKGQPRLGQIFVDECGKVRANSICEEAGKVFDCLKKVNKKWMEQSNNS